MALRTGLRLGCLLATGVLVLIASACSPKPMGDLDKLQIEIGRFDVSVKNISGQTLFDVKVSVVKAGGVETYSKTFSRLDNADTAESPFNSLVTEGGTAFSPRTTKVSTVRASAKDMNGAPLSAQIPWKMPK